MESLILFELQGFMYVIYVSGPFFCELWRAGATWVLWDSSLTSFHQLICVTVKRLLDKTLHNRKGHDLCKPTCTVKDLVFISELSFLCDSVNFSILFAKVLVPVWHFMENNNLLMSIKKLKIACCVWLWYFLLVLNRNFKTSKVILGELTHFVGFFYSL